MPAKTRSLSEAARRSSRDPRTADIPADVGVGFFRDDDVEPPDGRRLRTLAHAGGEPGGDDFVASLAGVGGVVEQAQRDGVLQLALCRDDEVILDALGFEA